MKKKVTKEEQTACKIVIRNQIARIQIEKEKQMQTRIDQLESDNYELNNRINDYIEERQNLIEKLENDIEELEILHDNYIDANIVEGIYETIGRISKAQEILSILKGEKE